MNRCCLTLALLLLPATLPLASEQPRPAALLQQFRFAIAPGSLPQVLNAFTRTTGLMVVHTYAQANQQHSSGLQGEYTAAEALERLLEGSGFRFRPVDAQTLTLEPRPEPADVSGSLGLESITITGETPTADSYQPDPDSQIMRSRTPTLNIPQTVNVVPAQVIRDQQPRNLDDALNNISGITQSNTLGGTQDAVMKRGFGGNRDGSIMRDGMPSILGRSMTASADHVEVLKGPATLLYGIQDPGGVINVVSKKPSLTTQHHLAHRLNTYAHGRDGWGGQFDTTGAIGDSRFAYRLIVDYEDEDYWRNFGTSREKLIAPSLAWYGDDTTLQLRYEHRSFHTPFDRGTAIDPSTGRALDVPRSQRLDESFNITEGRSNLTQFSIDHSFSEQWQGNLSYSWMNETYDDDQARVTRVDPDAGTLKRRVDATRGAVSTSSVLRLNLNGDIQLGGFRHELTFGIDSEKRKIFRRDMIRGSTTTFDYRDPDYGQIDTSDAVSAAQSDQRDELHSNAFYFQDSWHLDEHWILVAGARYQAYDQYAGKGRPFSANTNTHDQEWSPRLGVVYKLNDEMSVYASYTHSFKPNSTISALSSGQAIDSGIQPEKARSWEIGAKIDIPGQFTANLALFDIRKRNVLVSELDSYGDTVVRTAGKVRSWGVELDVSGQISERWNLIGSYAWLDARVTEDPEYDNNRLQNVAKTTASMSAVYDAGQLFGGDQLRLGGGMRYVGKRAVDASNTYTLPSYTVTDLFATYRTRWNDYDLGLQLNVKNLFDKTYYPSAGNQYYVAVGEARQFILTTTLDF